MKKQSILLIVALLITKDSAAFFSWFDSPYNSDIVYRDARGNGKTCKDLIQRTQVPSDFDQVKKYLDAYVDCATEYHEKAERHLYARRKELEIQGFIVALKARGFRFSDDFERRMAEDNQGYFWLNLAHTAYKEWKEMEKEDNQNNDSKDDAGATGNNGRTGNSGTSRRR
jgi:hypothetical protein